MGYILSNLKQQDFPIFLDKVLIPPLKCQGIKTKLTKFILSNIKWKGEGVWYDPFLGSGVVSFNAKPKRAVLSDINPYIIDFYESIKNGLITQENISSFLTDHGEKLKETDTTEDSYYYTMRKAFNKNKNPKYFLFLNRSCYNGVVRFNTEGNFNTPFCKKPNRFSKNLITKIVNQIRWVQDLLKEYPYSFETNSWEQVINNANENDFVYLDPPYYGRNATYFNSWSQQDMEKLFEWTLNTKSGYAITMWYQNSYRKNEFIEKFQKNNVLKKYVQYYFVGSTKTTRYRMTEALIIKPDCATAKTNGDNNPYKFLKK